MRVHGGVGFRLFCGSGYEWVIEFVVSAMELRMLRENLAVHSTIGITFMELCSRLF